MTNPGIRAKRKERNELKANAEKRKRALRAAQLREVQQDRELQARLKAEYLERQKRRVT